MTWSRVALCALLIGATELAASLPVRAQSLGEVAAAAKARRERERERKGPGRPKVFTEEDLLKGAPTPGEQGKEPPTPPDPAVAEQTPRAERSDQEKLLADAPASASDDSKGRANQARTTLTAAEQRLKQAEAEVERFRQDLNPMSTTFSQDPYVILRLQGELTKAEEKANEVRKEVEAARKEYEEFEAEARRTGAPPD